MQRTAEPRQGHFGLRCRPSLSLERYTAPHQMCGLKKMIKKIFEYLYNNHGLLLNARFF